MFPTINSVSLAPWALAGLAVEANPDDDSGIVFQLDWGTKEFNGFLRNHFQRLFGYLGTINPHVATLEGQPDDVGKKRIHYSWPYVLLKKNRKRYETIDITHPTALTYRDNLSGDTINSSFRGKAIYLGMCLITCDLSVDLRPHSNEGTHPTGGPKRMVHSSSRPSYSPPHIHR